MPTREATVDAAELIARWRAARQPIGFLPDRCRPRSQAAAYDVQEELHRREAAAGLGVVAGYKIGCTTPTMQKFVGVDSPCYGGVLDRAVHRGTGTFPHAAFLHVGVECEIAVRLGRAMTPDQAPFKRDAVAGHVAACMVAIEVVDDRYTDYKALDAAALIADDFFQAACVLGREVAGWRALDLAAARGTTTINGKPAGDGFGADVMGHPFEALAWLGNAMAGRGRSVPEGAFVLTGSIVIARWVAPGDRVVAAIDGLGEARADFV